MSRQSNYDKFPFIPAGPAEECSAGWPAIAARLAPLLQQHPICVECYPGVFSARVLEALCSHLPSTRFSCKKCLKTSEEIRTMLDPLLGSDRVFGCMSGIKLEDYFDSAKLEEMRFAVARAAHQGSVLVVGTGASFVSAPRATNVYADLARWEIQLRWRSEEVGNLGLKNAQDDFLLKYKCGFFAEWRAADRRRSSSCLRSIFSSIPTSRTRPI